MGPVVAQATFGGVMGFCTGVAVKRLGKLFAVVLGVGFLAVQVRARRAAHGPSGALQ